MTEIQFDLPAAIAVACAVAFAQFAVLRRLRVGLVHPLAYVALSTSFASAITVVSAGSGRTIAAFAIALAAYWLGVAMVLPRRAPSSAAEPVRPSEPLQFRCTVLLGVAVFLIANAYLWAVAGLPALSDDPTLSKVETFVGGLGFVRRINWGIATFVVFALTYQVLTRPHGRPWTAYLATLSITALSGSKGALLSSLFAIALVATHDNVRLLPAQRRLVRRLFPGLAVAAVIVAIGILFVESEADIALALQRIVIRLFYFGDVMFYWTDPSVRTAVDTVSPLDYPGHVLNTVLGALRLAEYQLPFGSQMVQASLSADRSASEYLGPNTPFYVKGELFFGPWIAPVYAAGIGWLSGWLCALFRRSRPTRPLSLCVRGSIVMLLPALAMEDSLFVSQVLDLLVVLLPIALLVEVVFGPTPRGTSPAAARPVR